MYLNFKMFKIFITIILVFLSIKAFSNENLLTIQQQLERLQREVSDLSQTVFSNQNNSTQNNNTDVVTNLSAIDMRIYDLEKDVKNLTANLEEVFFQIEDMLLKLNNFETVIVSLENSLVDVKKNIQVSKSKSENFENLTQEENTLGSIKITSDKKNNENNNDNKNIQETQNLEEPDQLSPEEEFQLAFDNIRNKNWEEAKKSLQKFIKNYPENQISGSAHYWLGELYILEKKFRDAALIFAEGYQKFPTSLKAPDMLYKLSVTLYNVDKINESCKTLEKLILDFPKNKHVKNAKKNIQDYGCLEARE